MIKKTISKKKDESKFPIGSVGMLLEKLPKMFNDNKPNSADPMSKTIQEFSLKAIKNLPNDTLKNQINDSEKVVSKIYFALERILKQNLSVKEALNIINQEK